MIAAFDVNYFGNECASAAAVLFQEYKDAGPAAEYAGIIHGVSPYVSGQFYKRELPCILRLLEQFDETPHEMVIDGYVMLGDQPGLGQHLFESFAGQIPIVGVAKSKFRNSSAIEILRGGSNRPLYVTSAGVDPRAASARIRAMHGAHRVPTLLRVVDGLARRGVGRSAFFFLRQAGFLSHKSLRPMWSGKSSRTWT
jgi:deoxyribonuclease V